jgi:hypothetical protein
MIIRNCSLLLFLLGLLACGQPDTSGGGFQEIDTEGSLANSAIVRLPVASDGSVDTVNVAKLTFADRSYDFGTVSEGNVVEHRFQFTNTGTVPLLISNARSTCGCTIPEWPREPIPPGGVGEIPVRFDTKNKTALQRKPIMITANTYPAMTMVELIGRVESAR